MHHTKLHTIPWKENIHKENIHYHQQYIRPSIYKNTNLQSYKQTYIHTYKQTRNNQTINQRHLDSHMLRTVHTLYVDAIMPGNIKHYMPGIFVQIWSTWQANSDGPHSSTIISISVYAYHKKEMQKAPWKTPQGYYIPYFSFFVANDAILLWVTFVLPLKMSLQNGILEDGNRRCRRCASFLAASSS